MLKRSPDSPKQSIWKFFSLLFFLDPCIAENDEETLHLAK